MSREPAERPFARIPFRPSARAAPPGGAEAGGAGRGPEPPGAALRRIRRQRRRPRFKGVSFNRMVPNLMTMLGLCAGLTGMRFALDSRFGATGVALLVAACIDGVDGRLARMLKATSRFGAEFDSLADFLCFGVAPAFILYLWSLHSVGSYGFLPCLVFAVCMALRLARFNASLSDGPSPAYAYSFFSGVPAPAGAGLALFPMFLGLEAQRQGWDGVRAFSHYPLVAAVALTGTALLLVSTLPVWNFKNFRVPAQYVLPLLLGTGVAAAVLVADPWAALAALGVVYVGMLPFSVRSFRRLRRDAGDAA